jgi:hypothetical protein
MLVGERDRQQRSPAADSADPVECMVAKAVAASRVALTASDRQQDAWFLSAKRQGR